MNLQILDASVALKWFFQEPGHEAALEILDQIKNSPKFFAVPELFFNEMLHVLCKTLPVREEIQLAMEDLQDLGLIRLGNGRQCLESAVALAKKYSLSGYDAIYAANAKISGGTWLTADREAHQKIHSLKISQLIA